MKKSLIALILFLCSMKILAQSSEQATNNDWRFVTEKQMVDVFYKVVECNQKAQIYLMVLNDMPQKRQISFSVSIVDQANKKVFKEITLNATAAEKMVPDCSADKWNELKIDLPRDFVLTSLSVKANFKKTEQTHSNH